MWWKPSKNRDQSGMPRIHQESTRETPHDRDNLPASARAVGHWSGHGRRQLRGGKDSGSSRNRVGGFHRPGSKRRSVARPDGDARSQVARGKLGEMILLPFFRLSSNNNTTLVLAGGRVRDKFVSVSKQVCERIERAFHT